MNGLIRKTVAVFARPFEVPGFDESLPAGEYEIETEVSPPPDHLNPEAWKASVIVNLHRRSSHPGLTCTLTVSLADLDDAWAKDKLTGDALADVLLEDMLADPMIQLVMEADGVSVMQLRHLFMRSRASPSDRNVSQPDPASRSVQDKNSIQAAENEGMPTQAE